MARTKAKSVKPKFSADVAEIFSQLKKKNDGVKLSMLKEATLVKQLSSKHNIKPTIIQKETKEFVKMAEQLINSKIDRRLKENKEDTAPSKKKEPVVSEPKRGRGRPRKEKTEPTVSVVNNTQPENNARKEKIKELIMNFLGKKISKSQNNSLNTLVETLIAN